MAIDAAFVVLSDLHFGRDLYDAPELPLLNFSPIVKWLNREEAMTRFFEEKCLGHDVACVKKLPRYLKCLLKELRDEEFEGDDFDLLLLLGDQATIPDSHTYKFLRGYLTQDKYETRDADSGFYCAGLGIAPENILAIPGNHDKLLQRDLGLYNSEFTVKLGLRDRVGPQAFEVSTRLIRGRDFVFVLLDASNYCKQELTLDLSCTTHLANGRVSKELRAAIEEKLGVLKTRGEVDGARLNGTYAAAVKIMLVHYAVDTKKVIGSVKPSEVIVPHGCEGLDEAVAKLAKDFQVNVVIHGHLHSPALYNHSGAQVIACTTTTQQNGHRGFFLMKFLDTGELRVEHHVWNGAAFAADPNKSLNKPFVTGVAA